MHATPPPSTCQGSCIPKVDISTHPCYSRGAHFRFGRIHVPVAPRCNIQCNYCVRKYACPNENRPGVTMRVVSPDQALQTIGQAVARDPRLRVLGVAGPGDALANDATITTFERAKDEFPQLTRCISTNGLLLPDRIDAIERAGISTLTITINAVEQAIGEQIYAHVRYQGKTYRGPEAFALLHKNQMEGLREAALRGMFVKVNSVLIPGVNDQHMLDIAHAVKDRGAYIMNIIPMLPLAKFAHLPEPTLEQVNAVRNTCATVIEQFRNCQRCRADAIGVPGEEGCGPTPSEQVCIPKFLAERRG
ncbi:radical SAM protein [Candidatus Viridilinea mediisalina]|uniref:Nitrogenase molybdenum-iron cofactor biosynthesis protein n=1 Tax=Candidatus Viridilinea mediisalina TaxID=2024553 RepID=A0A2A6RPU4_9CHLR|nr:radical SAM protein [Candidatus Viridilinea mediisalina]PDW04880.1 nitrogenase molybdenum-iron cofactor biosynthesis protein [Candidatus Viridilinea mediisalina]